MKKMTILTYSALALALGFEATADVGGGGGPSVRQPPPLPKLTTVNSPSLNTVDDLYMAMGFTRPLTGLDTKEVPYSVDATKHLGTNPGFTVYPDVDLIDYETDVLQQFMRGQGPFAADPEPAGSRAVIILRYGFDNPKAVQAMKDAKTLGLHSAVLVSDGPITMDSKKATFGTVTGENGQTKPANFTNDLKPEYILGNSQGKAMLELMNNGYQLSTPVSNPQPQAPNEQILQKGKFFITLSALIQNMLITPIMHEKEAIMVVLKDPTKPVTVDNIKSMYIMHGSGNWTTNNHINRSYLTKENLSDPNGNGRMALVHALSAISEFSQPGRSAQMNKIQGPGMLRLVAKDGSFIESAYTDGQFELNQRIVNFFEAVAANPDGFQINDVWLSHFVLTNRNVVLSVIKAWDAMSAKGRPFHVNGMLDSQYVELQGYGLGAALAGFDVINPNTAGLHGMKGDFLNYVNLSVDFEEVPNATNIDPNGAPDHRLLDHGKDTWVSYRNLADASDWVEAWTGSYNCSTNKNNLERQDQLHLPAASSKLAMSIQQTIDAAVKETTQRNAAVPLRDTGVGMSVLAKFLGQSPMDLNRQAVDDFLQLARAGKLDDAALAQLQLILNRAAPKPSRLLPKYQVSAADITTRIAALKRLSAWWQTNVLPSSDAVLTASDLMHLVLLTSQDDASALGILKNRFYDKTANPADIEKRAQDALNQMKGSTGGVQQLLAKATDKASSLFDSLVTSAKSLVGGSRTCRDLFAK